MESGETLYELARRFGVTVSALAAANKLSPTGKLKSGQSLRIPGRGAGGPDPAAAPPSRYGKGVGSGETRHTLKDGETIYSLARHYGVSESELMRLNSIRNPGRLAPGTALRIPRSAGAPRTSEKTVVAGRPKSELPEGWQWHVIRQGESLSRIAARHGIDRRKLERANNLEPSSSLRAGNRLKIPPADAAASAKPPDRRKTPADDESEVLGYYVLKGETVESVAGQFDTRPETIRRLNRMGRTESLVPGRRIIVPNNGIFD